MKITDLKLLMETAKLYSENLVNKNLLVIYQDRKTKKFKYLEFVFYKSNFLHLTGVNFSGSTDYNMNSILFFDKCLNNELSLNDFTYRADGTTRLKLGILRDVVTIHKKAVMIGVYNHSKPSLFTEKIYGNNRVCLGSVMKENGYYVPNTALKEDIRNLVSEWQPIKAIYTKDIEETKYTSLTKSSKDFDPINLDDKIKKLINL